MANDFSALSEMIYSGRGITIGMTPMGEPFIGYTLTGRSPSSQARRLVLGRDTGIISTQLIEDDKTLIKMFDIKSPEELDKLKAEIAKGSRALIVYPAIVPVDDTDRIRIVASNGAQTKLIYNTARRCHTEWPEEILKRSFSEPFMEYDEKEDRKIDITSFEPDDPNFTPRISACIDRNRPAFHIVRRMKDGLGKSEILRFDFYQGTGSLLTTYKGGNEKPLVSSNGRLLDMTIGSNNTDEICQGLYNAISNPNPNDGNKVYSVAAAVMMMKKDGGLESRVINRADIVMGA